MARGWLLALAVAAVCVGSAWGGSDGQSGADPSASSPPSPYAGYEAPDYTVIDTLAGEVEIRRYQEGQWVKYPVPGDDFVFMANYGNEKLKQFFEGMNYEHKEVKKSTPLRVTFDLWDLTSQRYAQYWVPLEEETLPPAPVPPVRIEKHAETFIFAKKYNDTMDFRKVCKTIAEGMVDLTVDGSPFELNTVSLAMYSYPKEGGGERMEDEIWYTRSFKHWDSPDVPVLREAAGNFSRAVETATRKMLK